LREVLDDDGGAWGPLFWLLVALSFLLGTYFVNAASLFMLGGLLEKRNVGARTTGTWEGHHCHPQSTILMLGAGEKTALTMPAGLIEGTETIIFYSAFICTSFCYDHHPPLALTNALPLCLVCSVWPQQLTGLFWLFGSLVSFTILQRLWWAYRHL